MKKKSNRLVFHIYLKFPLYSASRRTIFINTALVEKQTYVLKRPILLEQEPDNSEDIVCMTTVDIYLAPPVVLEHFWLEEYVSSYSITKTTSKK